MTYQILTAASLGIACAVLSVFVVMRRWAFIGEGISHSGLGGAGVAWMLALIWPAFNQAWAPYALAAVFCIFTAIGIAYFSRSGRLNADAAIGIFMVGMFAWGVMALEIYQQVRHVAPYGWDVVTFGRFNEISPAYTVAAVAICALVLITVIGLGKEILSYCFDPISAEVSGVRAGFIHYLLLMLIALAIIIAVRVIGSVLATALLVLPGVTGTTLTLRLRNVFVISVLTSLFATIGGVLVHEIWVFLPTGPVIVLLMLAIFAASYATAKLKN